MQASLCTFKGTKNLFKGIESCFHTSAVCNKVQSARYKPIAGRKQLLTYEMALPPHIIGLNKSWNSWNTSTLLGGRRRELTTIEDVFIRRLLVGSFFGGILGDQIIIKRQHNIVRIAACVSKSSLGPQQVYFVTGFCEEMLSMWLQCPVKLELQMVSNIQGYVKIV